MRVSLIQPPQGTHLGLTRILLIEPLALECVSAALRRHEHETSIVDLRIDSTDDLEWHLQEFGPEAVGISCSFTTDVYTTLQTARILRDLRPEAPVFVGGHHASLMPGDFLFPGSPVGAVVIGEGEETGRQLVDALERGDDPGTVPGVMTLTNRHDGFTLRPAAADLEAMPLPDRAATRRYRRRYHHGLSVPSAAVETSRGCPYNCNFCSIWVYYHRRMQRRSPERIAEDIAGVKAMGENHIFLTDDIAFLEADRYETLGNLLREKGLRAHYACETRSDLVVRHPDLFRLWAEVGLETVFLGIEKITEDGLDSVRKRVRGGTDTNVRAIEFLRELDITPMTALITDASWSEEDFERMERFITELRLPCPTFSILTPLPGTELWEARKQELTERDYAYFDAAHLVLPSRLDAETFYRRFGRLYTYADSRAQLSFHGFWHLVKTTLRGHGRVVRNVIGAVRGMTRAKSYLEYPGRIPRPDFLPEEHGSLEWVDAARSPMATWFLDPAKDED